MSVDMTAFDMGLGKTVLEHAEKLNVANSNKYLVSIFFLLKLTTTPAA